MTAILGFLIGIAASGEAEVAPLQQGVEMAWRNAEREDRGRGARMSTESLVIERRVIIRIPVVPRLAPDQRNGIVREGLSAPVSRCMPVQSIRSASIEDRAGIIFITTRGRYRASLERGCRPAEFQSGFYLDPSQDNAICAGRDLLRSRSGMSCAILAIARLAAGD